MPGATTNRNRNRNQTAADAAPAPAAEAAPTRVQQIIAASSGRTSNRVALSIDSFTQNEQGQWASGNFRLSAVSMVGIASLEDAGVPYKIWGITGNNGSFATVEF